MSQEEWMELGSPQMEKLKQVLERVPAVKKIIPSGNHLRVYFENDPPDAAWVNQYCFEQGVVLSFLQVMKKSLESAFIELTHNVSN